MHITCQENACPIPSAYSSPVRLGQAVGVILSYGALFSEQPEPLSLGGSGPGTYELRGKSAPVSRRPPYDRPLKYPLAI